MKIKTFYCRTIIFCSKYLCSNSTGYYDGTAGLTGAALKTKLSQIIKWSSRQSLMITYTTIYPSTDSDK